MTLADRAVPGTTHSVDIVMKEDEILDTACLPLKFVFENESSGLRRVPVQSFLNGRHHNGFII
ncbi:hypothetical protein CY34DRAFT_810550 [Suillus luteus UH-Slu-Lm8-n1]|uniref:Uncharacterized protein n=1 Tax=Suillus luteus UH-Slu-Lm8-n1 TaxID=930992 RepID=A0A0D0A6H1_9AGAM|nr:hypothetical protein CY34DRAFT_810550 [Suillus luteus UH-Slu-Lm8-n1]